MKLFRITTSKKTLSLLSFIALLFFITFILHFYSKTIVFALDNVGVLYRETPVTELYFTDLGLLPSVINPKEKQSFGFGIKNSENQTNTYSVHIVTIQGDKETTMRRGVLKINAGEKKEIRVPISIPDPTKDTRIEVRLLNKSPIIHFWMRPPYATPTPAKV